MTHKKMLLIKDKNNNEIISEKERNASISKRSHVRSSVHLYNLFEAHVKFSNETES